MVQSKKKRIFKQNPFFVLALIYLGILLVIELKTVSILFRSLYGAFVRAPLRLNVFDLIFFLEPEQYHFFSVSVFELIAIISFISKEQ
jgi:hypothetical protein